ncbi:MAG: GNAT family N-acetyltransferase [Ezakiella sp.]|uniref:GNAT family N-acetyltransferase n=1 Tax=Ezakiella sp. TaxID=1935205 RepID=UPI0029720A12|nr:GNAT family N-acetyltransferase [Ezakiella sp.]MDD7731733.1 GNAT family N-acetyltransferase [Eubacteriales bacterium]MDY6079615.1 GNAT family N-acetyltransferase [Ezakiella sp.]
MKLIQPERKHEKIVMDFKQKIKDANEQFCGVSGLERMDYDEWIQYLLVVSKKETCPEGIVPAYEMIYVDDDETKVYGMINMRFELNDMLLKFGGHIGYSVSPDERRKGYAKAMLSGALEFYRDEGYDKVLITCNKNNIASQKTIESAGGILENIVEDGGIFTKRFWIYL